MQFVFTVFVFFFFFSFLIFYFFFILDQADHIIYVTDEGQRFHFNQIFNAAKRARWINQESTKRKVQFDLLKLQQHALESKSIKKSKYVNSDVLSNKKKIQKNELKKLKQEILKIRQEFKNSDVSTANDSILSHVGFGLVKDNVTKNKLSSRDGDALPLSTLLDHATEAAKNGKYSKRRERASRNGSTVVDISIPPSSFKFVSLSLARFSLFKTHKQVFF